MKFLLIPFIFLFTTTVASACSFAPDADRLQEPESNMAKYEHVFVATITAKQEKEQRHEGNDYTFQVHKVYKGDTSASVDSEITISSPGHSCGSFFSAGQVGLFFLNDINTIDESNPRYLYDSKQQALQVGTILQGTGPIAIDPPIESPEIIAVPPIKPAVCTREYQPVCGEVNVQCVQAPCPPITRTYSNRCVLDGDGARFVSEGVCPAPITQELEMNFGITDNQMVVPPFTINGRTDGSRDWLPFEGQVGYVELYDGKGKLLVGAPMSVVGEWMRPGPHDFTVDLDFETTHRAGHIIFYNEQISGEETPISKKVTIRFNTGKVIAPASGPLDGFVEPIAPPPFDNSPKPPVVEKEVSWIEKIQDIVRGLFSWIL